MGKVRRVRDSGAVGAAVGPQVPAVEVDKVMGVGAEKGVVPGRGPWMGGW